MLKYFDAGVPFEDCGLGEILVRVGTSCVGDYKELRPGVGATELLERVLDKLEIQWLPGEN
jgi:hypothetical protein